jgi:recombination protein RecA
MPSKASKSVSKKSTKKAPVKKGSSRTSAKKKDTPAKHTKLSPSLLKEYQARISTVGVGNVATVTESKAAVKLHIPTQALSLDNLLGGGIPAGKIVEILGPPHVGKTTILKHTFAAVQGMGGVGVIADTELRWSAGYGAKLGMDPDAVQYLEWADNELYIENIVKAIFETVRFFKREAPAIPVVIGWDSLGGTASADDIKKGLGYNPTKEEDKKKSAKPGSAAKAMRMAMREIAPIIAGTNIALVILNHEYDVINTMGVGPKRKPYGGKGLTHAASIRLGLWPGKSINDSEGTRLGNLVKAFIEKDSVNGQVNRHAEFAMLAGVGIDNSYTLLNDLVALGVVVQAGSWFKMNLDNEIIAVQGVNGFKKKLAEDPTLFPRLAAIYQSMMPGAH